VKEVPRGFLPQNITLSKEGVEITNMHFSYDNHIRMSESSRTSSRSWPVSHLFKFTEHRTSKGKYLGPSFLDFALPFIFWESSRFFSGFRSQKRLIKLVFDVSDKPCAASIDTPRSTNTMRWNSENALRLHTDQFKTWNLASTYQPVRINLCTMLSIVRFAPPSTYRSLLL
jgi:hypothetical protein